MRLFYFPTYICNMKTINLAIVEDESVIRESLIDFMSANPVFNIRWAEESVEDFLNSIKLQPQHVPDIMLLDIQLPGMTGLEGIRWIKDKLPETEIIMLTTFEDAESIFKALREGASSYISKKTSLKHIMDAILVVSRGGSFMSPTIARKVVQHFNPVKKRETLLSPRHQQIVQCILKGKSYQQIADELFISIDTVRSHIKKIYKMLNVNTKTALINKSMRGEI